MQVLVTGSRGLVGSVLMPALVKDGHAVIRLVRSRPAPSGSEVLWDPAAQTLDSAGLEGLDAVIHLAGEPIATGRWTLQKQSRIHDSRVQGTRLLCRALARMAHPPKIVLCASATGYYGSRGDEWLTEASEPGKGFLAEVCQAWEDAAKPLIQKGSRVVWLRFGMILSPSGGAMGRLLPLFKLGLGGRLGNGRQYMSWVAIDDAVGAILHALTQPLSGPLNVVSPQPVTNQVFTASLAGVLNRPAFFPAPAWALRLALGQMADALLLSSTRVEPKRLQDTAYEFQYPEIETALRSLITGSAVAVRRRKAHAPVA